MITKMRYKLYGQIESHTLYYGIGELHGGWLLVGSGNPLTLEDCEESGDNETISLVNNLISEGNDTRIEYIWEVADLKDCPKEDFDYLYDYLIEVGIF